MGNPYGGQTPAPLNAPPTGPLSPGIQPGTTAGIIVARLVEIFGPMSGLFVYNPSPGAGNLAESISAVAGTDPYGNTVHAGFVVYGSNNQLIEINTASGPPALIFGSGAASENLVANINVQVNNRGLANEQIQMNYSGPGTNVATVDAITMAFISSPNNAANTAVGVLNYHQAGDTIMAQWGRTGFAGNLVAKMISTVPASNPATAETWHNLALATGFGAGTPTPQYQYEACNGGRVRLRGQVTLTANAVAGKTVATLPAGYRAATVPQTFDGVNNLSGWTIGGGTIQAQATGGITLTGTGTSGNVFWIDDNVIVLD